MARRGRKRKSGARERSGRLKRGGFEPDHGTRERWAHGGGMELEETIVAGLHRARAKYECLLDVLHARGDLGSARDATRRYDAGLWLRRLYLRTHKRTVGSRYDVVDRDKIGRQQTEMSDDLAVAHRLYRRTMLAMGSDFGVLRLVCCDDRPSRLNLLHRALDRLADWRGM